MDKYALAYETQRGHGKTQVGAFLRGWDQPANMELVRLWRDDCLGDHAACEAGRFTVNPTPLPTRLIDVTDLDHPLLHETSNLTTGPYVALSYCWGQGKKFLTLKTNHQAFRSSIPATELPMTFKDALYTTNRLGYKYIWIDAICIIQDDSDDLAKELEHMHDIYRHADLTICAQGAPNTHAGLFHTRSPLSLNPIRVQLTLTVTDQGDSEAAFTTTRDVTLSGTCNGKDYLKPRGWILQEEVLTSRALVFGSQMSWKCTERELYETKPFHPSQGPFVPSTYAWGGTIFPIGGPVDKMRRCLFNLPGNVYENNAERQLGKFAAWCLMVEEYSDKELSFASDNLRALSALSAMFAEVYDASYLAGLWKEDIVMGLCWYVALNDRRTVSDTVLRQKAPSWTWASVGKVRIRFPCYSLSARHVPNHNYKAKRAEVVEAFCTSLDPLNTPAAPAATSSTAANWSLRLRAPMIKAVLRRDGTYTQWRHARSYGPTRGTGPNAFYESVERVAGVNSRFPALLLHPDNDDKIIGEAALDWDYNDAPSSSVPGGNPATALVTRSENRPPNDRQDTEVLCLPLYVWEFHPDLFTICLILIPHGAGSSSSSYARIGLGFLPRDKDHLTGSWSGHPTVECEIV
ncbi:heterokaryon incompatibility protein-domain-containing protein [Apodospora peruviana]|uniref:Heterokaryon incompatibility protein-domain-containing protein n=1 Tax=Apodospora peruviana TaxID=516989 RepID=A0AAE0HZV2_9PEZI|nr:heterokaryon incompatibility protein-domain-containing protein [Apodospora peruviana]